MLQEPITYNKNIQLDPATKKLIIGLLNSLLSVVPVDRKGEPDTTAQEPIPDRERDLFIEEALRNAFEHEELLKGVIDPRELERYYAYLKDYREISVKLKEVLAAINSYRDTAYQFSFRLAELLDEHINMVSPASRSCLRVVGKGIESKPGLRVV